MCRTVNKRRSLARLFKLWWWCNCGCVFSRKKTCCNCWPREEVAVEMLRTSLLLFFRENCHTQKYFFNIFSRSIRETTKFRFLRNTFSLPTLVALFRATPSFTHRQGMVLLLFLIIQHIGLARGRHYRGMRRSWPCVAMFRIRIFYYADPGPYFSPFGSGSGEGDSNKTSQIRK